MSSILMNMKKANAVLAAIEDEINNTDEELLDLICNPYQNGREHGWALVQRIGEKQVSFSEYRNTDSIVVYFGLERHFSMQGNVPSEDVWKSAKFFGYNEYVPAANWIIDYFLGRVIS
jgi:hypothetical protein